MAEKVEILNLDINTQGLITKLAQTKAEIDKLKSAQKELTESNKSTSESFVKNEIELKRLQTSYNNQKNVVSQLSTESSKFASATQALTSAIGKEITSISSARENNTQLLKIRNEINLSTEEGKKKLDEINAKIDQNNAFIKENVSAYEQQKIAIGDYKNQITEAFNEINIFNGGLGGFIERSQQAGGVSNLLTSSLKGMTTGIIGVTRASLAFIATPIGAVIAAIGLVLGGLITYLKSTQEGVDKITAVTRPLQAVMESLFGVLQNVGKALFDAFSNPKKLLTDLAEFVKTNLINRFKAFGVILDGLVNLDFKKVADGVLQAGTGVENMTDKIANASKETGKFFDEAIKKGQELDRLEKELEKTRIKNKVAIGELTEELKAQNRIAEDQTKTLAEREASAQKSIEVAQSINKLKQQELDLEIAILKNKQSRNDTSRAEEEQLAELIAKKNEANAQELELVTTQQNKLNSIRKEAQAKATALAQKAVDDAIQKNKEEIDLYIQSQGIKKKSLEDELKFEEELSKKRLALLDREFKAGKITKTAYEAEKLRISNEFAQKQVDATIQNAQRELDIFKSNLEQRKADETFFTQDKLNAKVEENNQLATKEIEFQQLRLQQGVINEQQYQDAIDAVKENQRIKNEEAQKIRDEAVKEQQAIDLENQRILDEEKFTNEFDLQLERERIKYEQEIANAEKTGADTSLIEKKYALIQTQINEAKESAKRQQASQTFGDVAKLLGEQTQVGKAAGIANATMNTYEGITQVWKADSALPEPYATIAKVVSTGVVLASGLGAVKKITSTKVPSYADGGQVQSLSSGVIDNGANLAVPLSNGDDTLAYVKQGEVILNAEQQRRAGGVNFFKSIGVPSFAGGGFVGGNTNLGTQGGVKLDTIEMANLMAQANANLPAPVVSVQEINQVDNRVKVYESYANF